MARAPLKAEFFVSPDGRVTQKARSLKYGERRRIFERDGARCRKCGVEVRLGGITVTPFDKIISGHVDHIFPRARGGQNDKANLQLLCITCNAQKGARP